MGNHCAGSYTIYSHGQKFESHFQIFSLNRLFELSPKSLGRDEMNSSAEVLQVVIHSEKELIIVSKPNECVSREQTFSDSGIRS